MKIGIKLKQLRKAHALSLKELSLLTGISISFLSDIENERSNPSLENLELIATKLNTPISSFFDDTFSDSLSKAHLSPIIELLDSFDTWSESDKQELMSYLKAKQLIRTTANQ